MNAQNSIQVLQAYATGLSAQSRQHKVQSQVFAAMGLSKLAEKYAGHATEEAEWVNKFVDRIIDLGGEAKVEATPAQTILKSCTFKKAIIPPSMEKIRPITIARFLPSFLAMGHTTSIPTAEGSPPISPSVPINAPEEFSGFAKDRTLSNIQRT